MLASPFKQGLALISCAWLACGLGVSLNFYTSIDCKTASTITPSAALNLSTCVVTPGLVSLHYDTVTCAGGGIVIPYLFKDTACGSQQGILDFYKTGSDFHCLSDFASDSIAAVMLSCNQDHPEQPQGTSTVSVGQVATGAPPTTTSAASGANGNSNDDRNTQIGWNSLSLGERVGIIVAAAVVIFALCLIGMCSYLRRHRRPSPRRFDQPPPGPTWGPPPYPLHQLVSPDTAYVQVLDNVINSARQHAASGYFENGHVHPNSIRNPVIALPYQVITAAFPENDPNRKNNIGAAGELYMFEYLRNIGLQNFGVQNWKSEHRTRCRVHPEYRDIGESPNGIADLDYPDVNGVFTGFLLDHNCSTRWIQRGTRPTYHLEVKATANTDWRTPFFMSNIQEAHSREYSLTPSSTARVYIICRISSLGLGSGTRLDIYIDPEALRREGLLVFTQTAEGWRVQPR